MNTFQELIFEKDFISLVINLERFLLRFRKNF